MNRLERHVAIPSRVNVVHGHFPEVGSKRFVIPQFIFPPDPPLILPKAMEFGLTSDVARFLAGALILLFALRRSVVACLLLAGFVGLLMALRGVPV